MQSGRFKTDKNADDALEINNVAVNFAGRHEGRKKTRDQFSTVGII